MCATCSKYRAWDLNKVDIKDPSKVPWPGSTINYLATVSLAPISLDTATRAEWATSFYTEQEHAGQMSDVFQEVYDGGMNELGLMFIKAPR